MLTFTAIVAEWCRYRNFGFGGTGQGNGASLTADQEVEELHARGVVGPAPKDPALALDVVESEGLSPLSWGIAMELPPAVATTTGSAAPGADPRILTPSHRSR